MAGLEKTADLKRPRRAWARRARGARGGTFARLAARSRSERGFTLLEVMISILLLVLGIAGISRLTIGVTRAGNLQRETERATEGARAMIERIKAVSFSQAFRSFNATGSDDPGGVGTAPGANFAVAGLRPAPDDPDGLPGEVIFPTPADQPGQLSESVIDPKVAMPRDLNGDGAIDSANHATDYKLLPVRVCVRWQSNDGTVGVVELKTNLANY
jgi:prepilin-type N-terminal cleavage/methylation domain-containing protein